MSAYTVKESQTSNGWTAGGMSAPAVLKKG